VRVGNRGRCAAVLALSAVAAACSGGGSPRAESTTRPTRIRAVIGRTMRQVHPVAVHTANGVTVRFALARSSRMLSAFRARYAALVADDVSFGHPTPPDFCRPAESFQGTLSVANQHYALSGAVGLGSLSAVRVLQYGSSERFVDVLVKAFRPVREPLTVHLDRPAFTGPMTPLGGGWYVLAAPVGSAAPWYVQGSIREHGSPASAPIATIPETRTGYC
jgi:hypothetical protein